jgi:hypothetical protein
MLTNHNTKSLTFCKIQEYKTIQENLIEVTDKYNQASEHVTSQTNELQNLVDELERVKVTNY